MKQTVQRTGHACPECGEKMEKTSQKFMMECERCLAKKEE